MVYIVLGAVAVFCFLFCFIMLIQVERDPERHRPAWQDEDADEEKKIITYRSGRRIRGVEDKSTPWRHDPSDDEEELPEEEEEDLSATRKFSPAEREVSSEVKDDPSATKKFSAVRKDSSREMRYEPPKTKKASSGKAEPIEEFDTYETEDDPAGSKEEMLRKVHKVLNILLGILFAVALALLIFDIYLHSL